MSDDKDGKKKVCMYLCQDNEKARNDAKEQIRLVYPVEMASNEESQGSSPGSLGTTWVTLIVQGGANCLLATILKNVTIHLVKP